MSALSNVIYVGDVYSPTHKFVNRDIRSGSLTGTYTVNCVGNELPIDTFSFVVEREISDAVAYSPTDADVYLDTNNEIYIVTDPVSDEDSGKTYLTDVAKGTPVWWFISGSFFAKGYVDTIVRTARSSWKVTCVSGIGLLDERYHVGGVYVGDVSVYDLVGQIVNGAFPMYRDPALKEVNVYGWLPYDTARNNLHRLLFAEGIAITKRLALVDYTVGFLSLETEDVPSSRIALGGSVDITAIANRAEVTEHSFLQVSGTEETTLFSNVADVAVSHKLIVFSAPQYEVRATDANLTVEEWSANYAIVTGTGTLVGKPYTHVTNVIAIDETEDGEPLVTKSVTDNCLVTAVNSYNTARRVLDYYRNARRIKAKIMLDDEKCGQALNFTDPFGDAVTAYLEKMQVLVTSKRGANCELVQGYFPTNGGNNFDSYVIKAGASNTWTADADGIVRIVLIGGGNGGTGGFDGANETPLEYARDDRTEYLEYEPATWFRQNQTPEKGGNAGTPGQGGRILVIDKAVTQGETFTFTFGTAGQGGSRNGASDPTDGTDTSAVSTGIDEDTGLPWERSTEKGQRNALGWLNPINNTIYGASGEMGHPGGDGGFTDDLGIGFNSTSGYLGGNGLNGGDVGGYLGGKGGAGIITLVGTPFPVPVPDSLPVTASGGSGGGAAWGSNGQDGLIGSYEKGHYEFGEQTVWVLGIVKGGFGGHGADATYPSVPTYGTGGGGGNGGGGAGHGGGCWAVYAQKASSPDPEIEHPRILIGIPNSGIYPPEGYAYPTTGGKGSRGGHAGAGCAIILYNES